MHMIFQENLNQGRFETWAQRPEMDLKAVTQVHGTDIVSLETLPCEADGMVVSWEEMMHPLAIKTADCLPILIEGEKGVVFLHAGWRGLANGILSRPEIKMVFPQRIFIGPSIHVCCFEVSKDFKSNFPTSLNFIEKDDKLYLDLVAEAKDQIRKMFAGILITSAPFCTCCSEKFHSYRRNKTPHRNWNIYIKG
jgi:polyphenol oxidase